MQFEISLLIPSCHFEQTDTKFNDSLIHDDDLHVHIVHECQTDYITHYLSLSFIQYSSVCKPRPFTNHMSALFFFFFRRQTAYSSISTPKSLEIVLFCFQCIFGQYSTDLCLFTKMSCWQIRLIFIEARVAPLPPLPHLPPPPPTHTHTHTHPAPPWLNSEK